MLTIVFIMTTRWGKPSFPCHSNILHCYTHQDLNRTFRLPVRHAKVTAMGGRYVFVLSSQLFSYSTCSTCLLLSNGERLRLGCKPVVLDHTGCAIYTMVTIVSIMTEKWGIQPIPSSFQHHPLKRILHLLGLKPTPPYCWSSFKHPATIFFYFLINAIQGYRLLW